eukprot:m.82203 g.82203  ORF g.82203 m.82203 type:complete len:478 (+) comp14607_c0_seq1:40-1473(+)
MAAASSDFDVESLHLHQCDWIGFDLDHCLVRYNVPKLTQLIHTAVVRFLIDERGYPQHLMGLECTSAFFVKGLLFDSKHGNFLRLYADGSIHSCSHGTHAMPLDDAKQLYAEDDLRRLADNVIQHGRKDKRYFYFSTFFDMAGSLVAAMCVDEVEATPALATAKRDSHPDQPLFKTVLSDVLSGFGFNFDAEQFAKDGGHYFPALKADPARYVHPISSVVKDWLAALRHDGVKLFILTNSHADYTKLLMDFAFGEAWYDAFDSIVFKGEKPAFFTDSPEARPFYHVTKEGIRGEVATSAEPGLLLMNGNVHGLTEAFRHTTGLKQDAELQVVYFGDHLLGDILATSTTTNWSTVAVLEELLVHVDPLSVCLGDGCDVLAQDQAMADFMTHAVERWGSFLHYTSIEELQPSETNVAIEPSQALLFNWLMRSHSTLVVPHLHAVAQRDHRQGIPRVSWTAPSQGLILPGYVNIKTVTIT